MAFRWRFGNGHKTARQSAITRSMAETCGKRQNLSEVEPGATVEICCIEGGGRLARRLAEMGFIPGTSVDVLRRAPLSDPIEFQLRGYLVSLRREEARLVRIKHIELPA